MERSFLIPAILFLLSLAVRCTYELLKEARKIKPETKPVFFVVFFMMCVLWISWFNLCPADPSRLGLPDSIRWIGLAVFILGTILAVGSLVQLREVENIDHLVTTGLFKKIRHPMYTGFISWIAGWSIYHGAIISFAVGLTGIAGILWGRHLEERRLEVQFGRTYIQYRLTTWF